MGKNILKVLLANGLVAVMGLISSLTLPKILRFEDYAQFQSFLLCLSYIAVLHLGFPIGLGIKYAGRRVEELNREQYKSEFVLQLLIPSFFTIVGICISIFTRNIMALYVSLMILLYCFLGGFMYIVQAWEKYDLYALFHIVLSAGSLALPIIYFAVVRKLSGSVCIWSYLLVYAVMMFVGVRYNIELVKHTKVKKIFSKENFETEKVGLSFLLGNYINTLLHSIDKQFVQWFCVVQEFAYYSFALTMQSTMTIFITAVSQPLFPYLASGKLQSKEQYAYIKRLLLIMGSASGLAYFACSFVVKFWIPNYIKSLTVIRIYFAVFPAMAVINGLYLNLYKIKKMMRRYIVDLSVMLGVATIANYLAIKLNFGYCGVAFATTLINYLWYFYGQIYFDEFSLDKREVAFVILFLLEFVFILEIQPPFWGFIVYLCLDILLCYFCFKKEILHMLTKSRWKRGKIL